MSLQTMQISSVGLGTVVRFSGNFDLELPLCDLFPQVKDERSPHDRLAGGILFDLAPQFQELLLSTFGLFEVSPQAEFVLDQLSVATYRTISIMCRENEPNRDSTRSSNCQ